MISREEQKQVAAHQAASLVQPGMVVGLGSGTTMVLVLHALGDRSLQGVTFTGVATSRETAALAGSLHIPLASLDEQPQLDLALDGADEVDPRLNLIKGRGGALVREKIVATAADRFVIVADESKLVEKLGWQTRVPVEVVPFGYMATKSRLEALGLEGEIRGGKSPFRTDNGNVIVDCFGAESFDFVQMADAIKIQTGVVDHGLFLGMASSVVVGRASGQAESLHL